MGQVAAALHAATEEAHGVVADAACPLPSVPVSARQLGGAAHQPHLARLGHLLCHWSIESVLHVHLLLGRHEDTAALAPDPAASGLRVATVALVTAVTRGGGLPRLSRASISTSSRVSLRGLITSDAKSAGKRSAGNPHAPFDVAGVGNGPRGGTAPALDPTLTSEVSRSRLYPNGVSSVEWTVRSE